MNVYVKKTNLNPYGFRFQFVIDTFKIDYWYIGYKSSKSTAYRKGFKMTNNFKVYDSLSDKTLTNDNNSLSNKTILNDNDSLSDKTLINNNDSLLNKTIC